MSAGAYLDSCGFNPVSSGTGDFVVSAAITGYRTPASASAVNGTIYSYRAESADRSQWEDGYGAYTSGTTTLARTTVTSSSTGSKVSFTSAPNVYITALTADLQNVSLLTSGIIPSIARIATGTADGFQYVRDDRTLAYPLKGVLPVPTDWNDVQTPGVFTQVGMANAPNGDTGNWFYVTVKQHVGYAAGTQVYLTQTASGLTLQGMWARTCVANTWGAWRQLDRDDASVAKAWVNFNGTGTVAIQASYNVSSITDRGTGKYTVNFTTAFADAKYSAVAASAKDVNDDANCGVGLGAGGTILPTASACPITTSNANTAGLNDRPVVCATFFR